MRKRKTRKEAGIAIITIMYLTLLYNLHVAGTCFNHWDNNYDFKLVSLHTNYA